jgi:hypothetical protein
MEIGMNGINYWPKIVNLSKELFNVIDELKIKVKF